MTPQDLMGGSAGKATQLALAALLVPAPLDTFEAAVEAARAAAIASGIPRALYYEKAVLGK